MSAFPTSLCALTGRDEDGVLSTTLHVALLSDPVRSIGLAGDDVTVLVREEEWPPAAWDLTQACRLQFGDASESITLDGYLVRRVDWAGVGVVFPAAAGDPAVQTYIVTLTTIPGVLRDSQGGLIRERTFNPLGTDGLLDTGHPDFRTNSQLASIAITYTGSTHDPLPAGMDDIDPPGPLDWGLARALPELEGLLARIGCAAAFTNDATRLNVVRLPKAGEALAAVPHPSEAEPYALPESPALRAPRFVVTSGQTRTTILTTLDLDGLEWVYFDTRTGAWLNQDEHDALYPTEIGPDDIDAYRDPTRLTPEQRQQCSRLFSALRVVDASMRRLVNIGEGMTLSDGAALGGGCCAMRSLCAIDLGSGQLRLEDAGPVRVEGVRPVYLAGVFRMPGDREFVKFAGGGGTRGDAEALTGSDLQITFAYESHSGEWEKDYFAVGFRADDLGVITQMTETELSEALSAPGQAYTVVVAADYLRRIMEWLPDDPEPTPLNDTELTAIATSIAHARAGHSLARSGFIELRGLKNVEPGAMDGAVTSVTWRVRDRRTVLAINRHEVPESFYQRAERSARRSIASGIGRYSLPGSGAALHDVSQFSAPGANPNRARAGGGGAAGDAMAGGATRGAEAAGGAGQVQGSQTTRESRAEPITRWLARITSATALGDNRWSYGHEEVRAGDAGAFIASANPRTHTTHGLAYNMFEAGNDDTGIEGSGIDVANLPTGFDLVPIGVGAIVEMLGPFLDSEDQPWCAFSAPNAVDGACEGGGA